MEKNVFSVVERIRKNHPNLTVIDEPLMAEYTSFKAGGRAKALIIVDNKEELKAVLKVVSENDIPHLILGNGSNTLFKDEGFDGVVIKLGDGFNFVTYQGEDAFPAMTMEESKRDDTVYCGTSILLSTLAKLLMMEGLSGFEFASGIPGSLGGAIFMNAGAYGGEMKDIVEGVLAVAPDGSCEKVFTSDEMEFSYRHSKLEENGYIAVGVSLQLSKGDKDEIQALMRELMEKRNSKQPVAYPSAGSTFKRPEGYFAAKLIEDAGLKGVAVGGAQVSTLHSGFVINKDKATATDIILLMSLIQNTVYDKFGVKLEPEVKIIG